MRRNTGRHPPAAAMLEGMEYAGVEYVTTSEACGRLAPDVGPETLRNWYAPRGGSAPRVRLLRNYAGRPVRVGREYLVAWPDVVEAEHTARTAAGGRPRGGSVRDLRDLAVDVDEHPGGQDAALRSQRPAARSGRDIAVGL